MKRLVLEETRCCRLLGEMLLVRLNVFMDGSVKAYFRKRGKYCCYEWDPWTDIADVKCVQELAWDALRHINRIWEAMPEGMLEYATRACKGAKEPESREDMIHLLACRAMARTRIHHQ